MTDSEPIPKWMMRRYAQIWKFVKDKPFTLDEAADKLKEDKKVLLVLFSNLRKKGWIDVQFNPEDARKRVYSLRNPEQVVEAMSNENTKSNS